MIKDEKGFAVQVSDTTMLIKDKKLTTKKQTCRLQLSVVALLD
jgi:hypothetical protein